MYNYYLETPYLQAYLRPWPVREHDSIISVWSTCLRSVGVYHKQEVKYRYVDSSGSPDIVTFESGNLSNAEIDVFLARPYNEEPISTSAKVNGHAASVREKKIEKYAQFRHHGGFTPEVIPLVFKHYGKWGSGAINVFKSLGYWSTDDFGRKNKAEFMSYWRRPFGVALLRANAQVILRKLDRLTDCSSTLFNKANPFDFCSQLCVH